MAHQIEDSGERNTIEPLTSSKSQIAPRKVGRPKGQKNDSVKYAKKANFIGTWNSFPSNYIEIFKEEFADFVCQEEIGASGNHHVQFAGRTESKRAITAMAKRLKGAHLEFADNWIACLNYCSKQDTCVLGTHFEYGNAFEKRIIVEEKKKIIDPMEGKEFYWWQAEVRDIIVGKPDDRKVFWYYDLDGNKGKTSLAKHFCLKYPGVLYMTGKAADMKYAITEYIAGGNELKCIIMDFARSQEDFISYQGLEEIKNGIFFNSKYESGMVMFNIPHIIVFSNFEPKLDKLSADRWVVKNIDSGEWDIEPPWTCEVAIDRDENMDSIYFDLAVKMSLNQKLEMEQYWIIEYYENMLRICYEPLRMF